VSRYDDQCVALRAEPLRNHASGSHLSLDQSCGSRRRRRGPFVMAWRALVSKRLHELRIVCCAEAPSSAPVRAYLRNNYATLKTLNPKFPFLVRAAEDKPYVVATYGMGHTETRDLDGLDEAQVEKTFEELVALGERHPRSWPAADDLPPDIVAAPGAEWGADPAEKAA
jgi:NADH dehydrogenase (ubiquinone) 1 alpha subcomplex subunit 2